MDLREVSLPISPSIRVKWKLGHSFLGIIKKYAVVPAITETAKSKPVKELRNKLAFITINNTISSEFFRLYYSFVHFLLSF